MSLNETGLVVGIHKTMEARIRFPSTARRLAAETMLTLPEELRPTHMRTGEEQKPQLLGNYKDFLDNIETRDLGLFLENEHLSYNFGIGKAYSIILRCSLPFKKPSLSAAFMRHMADAQPDFGFCCSEDEINRKNCLESYFGINHLRGWVGLDIERYIPGLYWLTIVSSQLLEYHGIPIQRMVELATEHTSVEGARHIFHFYQKPEDWISPEGEMTLHTPFPAIFDIEKVRAQTAGVTNFMELTKILHAWK